jgi:hypothetical protein
MKSIPLDKFSSPNFLQEIQPRILLEFLKIYNDYFSECGITLDSLKLNSDDKEEKTNAYHKICKPLRNYAENAPEELFDSLFLVGDASRPKLFDPMREILEKNHKDILDSYDFLSPADLAVLLATYDRRKLELLCIEDNLSKRKTFTYFIAADDKPRSKFIPITDDRLNNVKISMNFEFDRRKRGKKSAEIIHENLGEGIQRFIIRKGDPISRQEGIAEDSGDALTNVFRPAVYDLVLFREKKREIRISMKQPSAWAEELYRKQMGILLFDDEDYFIRNNLIRLSPIGKDKRDVLKCDDIVNEHDHPLLEHVRLVSCNIGNDIALSDNQIAANYDEDFISSFKGADVFTALDQLKIPYHEHSDFREAVFKIKPKYRDKEFRVRLPKSNKASYDMNDDAFAVEQWLSKRGFLAAAEENLNDSGE